MMFLKKLIAVGPGWQDLFPAVGKVKREGFSPAEQTEIEAIREEWAANGTASYPRPYGPEVVWALRGGVKRDFSWSDNGARKLRAMMARGEAFTSWGSNNDVSMSVEAVRAGAKAIYFSGWQAAAAANVVGMLPDMSLYMPDDGPKRVKAINLALHAQAQMQRIKGQGDIDWMVPAIMDLEAGYGHFLNAYLVTMLAIEAGAAAVHIEDQGVLKKCGHLGGKVVVPVGEQINRLIAARLAADVAGVPLVIIARTDSQKAGSISGAMDPRDEAFLTGKTSPADGVYGFNGGNDAVKSRLAHYAPFADILWAETEHPNLAEYLDIIAAVRATHPNAVFAYNCSPSFDEWSNDALWEALNPGLKREEFISKLIEAGVIWPFITLAGCHTAALTAFKFARDFLARGMAAFRDIQAEERVQTPLGYGGWRHQQWAGTQVFDLVQAAVTAGASGLLAAADSTEARFRSRDGVVVPPEGGNEPPKG